LNVTSLSENRINPKDTEGYKTEPKMVSGTISDGLTIYNSFYTLHIGDQQDCKKLL